MVLGVGVRVGVAVLLLAVLSKEDVFFGVVISLSSAVSSRPLLGVDGGGGEGVGVAVVVPAATCWPRFFTRKPKVRLGTLTACAKKRRTTSSSSSSTHARN